MEQPDIHKQAVELSEARKHDRFNRMVAITVAVLALAMVLGKVKENNVATGVTAVLVNRAEFQNQYGDRSLKHCMYKLEAQNWQLLAGLPGVESAKQLQQQIATAQADCQAEIERLTQEEAKMTEGVKREQATRGMLVAQQHMLQFGEALMTLALTLLAVSALVRSKPLYGMGLVVALVGATLELGGFLGWSMDVGVLHFLT